MILCKANQLSDYFLLFEWPPLLHEMLLSSVVGYVCVVSALHRGMS